MALYVSLKSVCYECAGWLAGAALDRLDVAAVDGCGCAARQHTNDLELITCCLATARRLSVQNISFERDRDQSCRRRRIFFTEMEINVRCGARLQKVKTFITLIIHRFLTKRLFLKRAHLSSRCLTCKRSSVFVVLTHFKKHTGNCFVPAHVHIHQLSGRRSHLRRTERRLEGVGRHVPWQHGLREGLRRELSHGRGRVVSVLHLGRFGRHLGSGGQRRQRWLVAGQEEQGGAPFASRSRATAAGQLSPDVAVDGGGASLRGDGYRGDSQAGEKQENEGRAKHPSRN